MSPSAPGRVPRPARQPSSSLRYRLVRQLALLVAATAALVGALGATPASAAGVIYPPHDPFYAAPENLATYANGDVIRSRKAEIKFGERIKLPFKAYQVLFRTTDRQEKPIATSSLVIIPQRNRSQNPAERNLLSYQTAYDGLSPACQPSFTLRSGRVALQAVEVLPMLNILRRGWTIVTTDYEGPNNTWGVGVTTGRGVLDGIRAAERLPEAGLNGAATKVGLMGYSGGGNASAWANEHAPGYAPELNIIGAAYGGVGADMATIVRALDGELYAGIAFAGIVGVTSGYPELDMNEHLNNAGKRMFRELKSQRSGCISDFFLKYPFHKFRSYLKTASHDLLKSPKFMEINAENSLGRFAPKAPTYWYHTYFDEMGSYWANTRVARWYCEQGTPLEFRTSYIEEHAMQAILRVWGAQDWMDARFKGKPFPRTCPKLG